MIAMEIQSLVRGNSSVPSLIFLQPTDSAFKKLQHKRMDPIKNPSLKGNEQSNTPDVDSKPILPIRVGTHEASVLSTCIDRMRKGCSASEIFSRPTPFDIILQMLKHTNTRIVYFEIYDVKGTVFYARGNISQENGESFAIEVRPSDACVLSILLNVALFVDDHVISSAQIPNLEAQLTQQQDKALENFISSLDE